MAGVVVAFTEHCNATSGGCGCYEMLSVGSVARYSLWMCFSFCFMLQDCQLFKKNKTFLPTYAFSTAYCFSYFLTYLNGLTNQHFSVRTTRNFKKCLSIFDAKGSLKKIQRKNASSELLHRHVIGMVVKINVTAHLCHQASYTSRARLQK